MESKDKCDVTARTEDDKTQLTKRYCKVSVIKREEDQESERGGCGGERCSEVDTRGKGQMEPKKEK